MSNLLDDLMNSPKIRSIGLKKETVSGILKEYDSIILSHLLDNGYIDLGNGLMIEIVRLTDRVHVLRGVPYKSSRRYKLKLNMDESIYTKIKDYYDKLEEDIK